MNSLTPSDFEDLHTVLNVVDYTEMAIRGQVYVRRTKNAGGHIYKTLEFLVSFSLVQLKLKYGDTPKHNIDGINICDKFHLKINGQISGFPPWRGHV